MESPPRKVFISYSLHDTDIVRGIAHGLADHGIDAWFFEEGLRPGDDFAETIREQLDTADAFIVVISDRQSPQTHFEMSEVLKRVWADPSKIVLPVLVGGELPGYLRDQFAVKITQPVLNTDWLRDSEWLADLVSRLAEPKASRGVQRTPDGDSRLERRLEALERTAASLAEAEEVQ